MAAAMTYDSLVTDIIAYAERTDAAYETQVPRFIMLTEQKIAMEVRNLGYIKYVTGNFPVADPSFAKPARWRQTVSFNYTDPITNKRVYLYPRSYDYCRTYWPNPVLTDKPVYYADYDYEHYFISPTPAAGYALEISYHERPQPLDVTNQTNWTTQYAPQLLLYGCMVEAMTFLKNMDKVQLWQGLYNEQVKGLAGEEAERAGQDRATKRVQD